MIGNQRRFELASKGLEILKRVSEVVLRQDIPQKQIGFALGKSEAWISQALGYGGQSKFTLDQVPMLREMFGIEILRILADGSGCFICENPTGKTAGNFARVLKEFAELAKVTAIAMDDDRITDSEAASIRREWEHLKSVGEAFVKLVERGGR